MKEVRKVYWFPGGQGGIIDIYNDEGHFQISFTKANPEKKDEKGNVTQKAFTIATDAEALAYAEAKYDEKVRLNE